MITIVDLRWDTRKEWCEECTDTKLIEFCTNNIYSICTFKPNDIKPIISINVAYLNNQAIYFFIFDSKVYFLHTNEYPISTINYRNQREYSYFWHGKYCTSVDWKNRKCLLNINELIK